MELLNRVGLYLDAQNDLRIIDTETLDLSVKLRDQLKQLIPSITNFHQQLKGFIQVMLDVEKLTDHVRLRVLASRNSPGVTTLRSNLAQQQSRSTSEERIDMAMRDLINEKTSMLERLNAELMVTSNLIEDQQQLMRCLDATV